MRHKVYCSECRHFSESKVTIYKEVCNVPDPKSSTYKERISKNFEPKVKNKCNQCSKWEHKRGFIEWLNDLLH